MKIEVSNGEILDKISILEIKIKKIDSSSKISNISNELSYLKNIGNNLILENQDLFEELKQVNETLWDVEDALRILEKKQDFNSYFVELARSVYKLNDRRAKLKKMINIKSQSFFVEEKSYDIGEG